MQRESAVSNGSKRGQLSVQPRLCNAKALFQTAQNGVNSPFNHVCATRKRRFKRLKTGSTLRSTTFVQRESAVSNGSKRGFPFGRDLRRPTQTQSALWLQLKRKVIYLEKSTTLTTCYIPTYAYIYLFLCIRFRYVRIHTCPPKKRTFFGDMQAVSNSM